MTTREYGYGAELAKIVHQNSGEQTLTEELRKAEGLPGEKWRGYREQLASFLAERKRGVYHG